MAALLLFVCAVLACQTQAQYLPRLPSQFPPQLCNPPPKVCNPPPVVCTPPPVVCNPAPLPCNPPPVVCNPAPLPCNTPPVVCNPPPVPCNPPVCNSSPQPCSSTTQVVVDNSVSNALANALQLLIVSNLIENTMKLQCCDPIPTVYSPTIDCLGPINPYNPYDNIITPCEMVAPCPCDPIEVIPTVCYPDFPIANIGCGCDGPNYGLATVVPNYGCGCDGFGPNIGCGCDTSRFLPNVGCGCGCDNCPRFGCDCDKYTIQNYGLPNVGCDCGPRFGIQNIGYELLANVLGAKCGCDLPLFAPQNCNCGCPNLPLGINVESLGFVDSCGCPNKSIYY